MLENKQVKQIKEELVRSGNNFLGILNDIKRQPENAADELGVSINQINSINLISSHTKMLHITRKLGDCQWCGNAGKKQLETGK